MTVPDSTATKLFREHQENLRRQGLDPESVRLKWRIRDQYMALHPSASEDEFEEKFPQLIEDFREIAMRNALDAMTKKRDGQT